jgi:hypothetical protein
MKRAMTSIGIKAKTILSGRLLAAWNEATGSGTGFSHAWMASILLHSRKRYEDSVSVAVTVSYDNVDRPT